MHTLMKLKLLFVFTLATWFSFSQVPSGYYSTATGSGYTLKTQLHNIIDDHNDQGYSAIDGFMTSYDLDNYYETGSNTILDVYSENPSSSDPYNFTPGNDECGNYSSEGDCYNKEHVIPQSVFSSNTPMQSDAHQLLPTDGRVNGFRGNYPFGRVNDNNLVSQSGISNPTQNGSKLGANLNSGYSSGYSGTVFEPIDEFKGDIARIYFYFITRYESQVGNWSSFAMFDGSSDQVLQTTFLNILLEWHSMDPVSQKEIDRNNNIYYNHQSNRNPFIDYPEYVTAIWSQETDLEAPTPPTDLAASNATSNSIDLNWTASTDNIGVNSYDVYIDGTYYSNTAATTLSVTNLSNNTNYCFVVYAKDSANNTSSGSNQVCESTIDNGTGGGYELFFSEYIEGSSTNKVLEIANFTGTAISLSNYSLKLSSNSNTGWTASYVFPTNAQISNEDVYIIANGGSTLCTDTYDDLNNGITGFNGNDAIGLFKNEVLIDIIGALGDNNDFAKDVTLVRKETIAYPNTTYTSSEWNEFPTNNCTDIGSHNQTLAVINTVVTEFNFYPNPAKLNKLFFKSSRPLSLEVYSVTGKLIVSTTVDNSRPLDISSLNTGLYIIRMTSNNSTQIKKLVRE